ncbi:MAG: hypothetical protein CFE37_06345 [Alphaproteobacteria bacterium PA4]|nr:MAG: hypothetical protein CFE37_06345 [Alphaproteobacteria bacterium PA4]
MMALAAAMLVPAVQAHGQSIGTFTSLPDSAPPARLITLKNADKITARTVTTKTPIYGPVTNSSGQVIGQRIIGYNSTSVRVATVAPSLRIFSSAGTSTAFSSPIVAFTYQVPLPAALSSWVSGPQRANFTLDATATAVPVSTTIGGQPGFSLDVGPGRMSFIRTVPVQLYSAVAVPDGPLRRNLLTVTFQSARITTVAGQTNFMLSATSPDQSLVYTSDFLDLSALNRYDFSLSMTADSPGLSIAPLDPIYASVTGGRSFASTKASVTPGLSAAASRTLLSSGLAFSALSAVPEPQSWALLLTGFALVGAVQRRQPRRAGAISAG